MSSETAREIANALASAAQAAAHASTVYARLLMEQEGQLQQVARALQASEAKNAELLADARATKVNLDSIRKSMAEDCERIDTLTKRAELAESRLGYATFALRQAGIIPSDEVISVVRLEG